MLSLQPSAVCAFNSALRRSVYGSKESLGCEGPGGQGRPPVSLGEGGVVINPAGFDTTMGSCLHC